LDLPFVGSGALKQTPAALDYHADTSCCEVTTIGGFSGASDVFARWSDFRPESKGEKAGIGGEGENQG
jgi:hypothetical protein